MVADAPRSSLPADKRDDIPVSSLSSLGQDILYAEESIHRQAPPAETQNDHTREHVRPFQRLSRADRILKTVVLW